VEATKVSVAYTVALIVVIAITLVCLLAMIVLSVMVPDPTASQSDVMSIIGHGFTAGLGGLLGIIGGKLA